MKRFIVRCVEIMSYIGFFAFIIAGASGGYQRVFCPWPQDSHDDHRATFAHLRRAVTENDLNPAIWLYEVWKPLPAIPTWRRTTPTAR